MKNPLSIPKPEYDYVGRKPCGCCVAVVAEIPGNEKGTAKWVAGFIRDGLAVERIPHADFHKILPLGCKCEPKPELTAQMSLNIQ